MDSLAGMLMALTRESSVSFGSLRASVAHASCDSCVSHESLLTSGPFETRRTLRTLAWVRSPVTSDHSCQPPRAHDPFVWAHLPLSPGRPCTPGRPWGPGSPTHPLFPGFPGAPGFPSSPLLPGRAAGPGGPGGPG